MNEELRVREPLCERHCISNVVKESDIPEGGTVLDVKLRLRNGDLGDENQWVLVVEDVVDEFR